jgi:glucose/arabinose dehydrogenase
MMKHWHGISFETIVNIIYNDYLSMTKFFLILNSRIMKKVLFIFLPVTILFFSCKKETVNTSPGEMVTAAVKNDAAGNLTTATLVSNLNFPWEILWGPDNFIWMTERQGKVSRVNSQTGQVIPVATISDVATTTNFNGLLGMVLHPQFSTNPFVYVIYNYVGASGDFLEKIVRFTFNGTTLVAPMIIVDNIVGKPTNPFIHNGSRLLIGPDMKLYATTGDADQRFEFPQNLNSLNGKVLRVNLDGTIPSDNPFANAVWSFGDRNAQGLVFANGKLYESMHGETTNDEINIIQKGRNNGWPFVEGFCDLPAEQTFCAANNVNEPIFAWTPTIAPSGMDYYNNNAIAQWKNSLLLAVLKDQRMIQLKLDETGNSIEAVHEYFINEFGRLRDIAISPDGKVYICTDNGNNSDKIIVVTKG